MIANIKNYIKSFVVSLALISIIPFSVASAQTPAAGTGTPPKCGSGITFFPTWYDGICDQATGGVMSPGDPLLGGTTEARFSKWIGMIAMNLVTMLLVAVGYVSLGFIIFGGFKYMTSGDNSSGTAAARKTITNAVIGLVLSIMSVALIKFVAMAVGA
jgi:hypothetical protein